MWSSQNQRLRTTDLKHFVFLYFLESNLRISKTALPRSWICFKSVLAFKGFQTMTSFNSPREREGGGVKEKKKILAHKRIIEETKRGSHFNSIHKTSSMHFYSNTKGNNNTIEVSSLWNPNLKIACNYLPFAIMNNSSWIVVMIIVFLSRNLCHAPLLCLANCCVLNVKHGVSD